MAKLMCDKCGMEAPEGAESLDKCKSPTCFSGLYRPAATEVIEPVTRTDGYEPTPGAYTEFGIDAKGRKCFRDYRRKMTVSGGGDSLRDDESGKTRFLKDLEPGEWKLSGI